MQDAITKPWPSIDGPSIFSDDPHFLTWEARLHRTVSRDEPGLIGWAEFFLLCQALGRKAMRSICGVEQDKG